MGFKSFNLVTLQLIIPLSTMTKAEYKDAYGIDLDDIDIEKVTLLQEEGSKNKYFVDEVKTTVNGVDIYAGGKVLSIGSSVSLVDNAYSVANSKPIYWHGINMYKSNDSQHYTCQFHILNNSPDPIDNITKIQNWLNSIPSGVIIISCNGAFFTSDLSDGGVMHAIVYNKQNAQFELYYVDSTGSNKVTASTLGDYFNAAQDEVNKIN